MSKDSDFNYGLLRRLRREANMSQEEVAIALRAKKNTVYNWERGQYDPKRKNIVKLEKLFNVPSGTFSLAAASKIQNELKPPEKIIENWQTYFYSCLHGIANFSDKLGKMSVIDAEMEAQIKAHIESLEGVLLETITKLRK